MQVLTQIGATPRGPSMAKRLAPLQHLAAGELQIHEIYASVQGEGTHVGLPCTLVRLTGCHLRCSYCDTPHAFAKGQTLSIEEVVQKTLALSPRLVLVTGGEPLLQQAAWPLMERLCDEGCTVLLETSGAIAMDAVDARVCRIVDVKTPSSGESAQNHYANLTALRRHDEVKFVLGSREDYLWARDVIAQYALVGQCEVLLGPVWGQLAPATIVAWMLEDALQVRLQVQLHKYIWDADAQGV